MEDLCERILSSLFRHRGVPRSTAIHHCCVNPRPSREVSTHVLDLRGHVLWPLGNVSGGQHSIFTVDANNVGPGRKVERIWAERAGKADCVFTRRRVKSQRLWRRLSM